MTSVRLFAVLGIIFLLGLAFYLLEGILTPFLTAWVAAYLLVPVVDRLSRRMPRWLAVLLVFLCLGAAGAAVVRWILPQLQQEMLLFMDQLPRTMDDVARLIQGIARALHIHVASKKLTSDIQGYLLSAGSQMVQGPALFFSTAAQAVKVGIYVCLIPIVLFYLLRDWHALSARMVSLTQGALRLRIQRVLTTSNEVFRHFIHGQLMAMAGFGALYATGYLVSGISLGLFLGIVAGCVSAIPFAAFALTGLPAILLATVEFHGISHLILVILTIAGSELIGNLVLMPVLVGRYVKVHAVAVLFLIFAGGALFGILGMLMAIPLAAILAAYETQYGVLHDASAPAPPGEPNGTTTQLTTRSPTQPDNTGGE